VAFPMECEAGHRPPDRDIPFWVGCAVVLEPKRHMRVDRVILSKPSKFERVAQVGQLTRTEYRPGSSSHMVSK
jgi:hypothetical protein